MSAIFDRRFEPVSPVLVPWAAIIHDIEAAGVSAYRVSQILNVEWSVVQRWKDPKGDIGFGYGRALLALHVEICGQNATLQRLEEAVCRA